MLWLPLARGALGFALETAGLAPSPRCPRITRSCGARSGLAPRIAGLILDHLLLGGLLQSPALQFGAGLYGMPHHLAVLASTVEPWLRNPAKDTGNVPILCLSHKIQSKQYTQWKNRVRHLWALGRTVALSVASGADLAVGGCHGFYFGRNRC